MPWELEKVITPGSETGSGGGKMGLGDGGGTLVLGSQNKIPSFLIDFISIFKNRSNFQPYLSSYFL